MQEISFKSQAEVLGLELGFEWGEGKFLVRGKVQQLVFALREYKAVLGSNSRLFSISVGKDDKTI